MTTVDEGAGSDGKYGVAGSMANRQVVLFDMLGAHGKLYYRFDSPALSRSAMVWHNINQRSPRRLELLEGFLSRHGCTPLLHWKRFSRNCCREEADSEGSRGRVTWHAFAPQVCPTPPPRPLLPPTSNPVPPHTEIQ